MSDVWTRWQGHVINGVFPLGRLLGYSDHSGVFLTQAAALGPTEVAIKLVPADRALVELLLPRWKRAAGIVHPRLLKLLQWGGCQLDGQPYLYLVMEYADQTLAQVLQHRALTDDEAREMLGPALDALAFLHGQGLVQGRLQPANILAVGDQLKLASDTTRRVSESGLSGKTLTVYDPPEARHGRSSTAGDIWALGVCLFEALTGRPPPDREERGEAVTLPVDFSPAFRDVVARCLNPSPEGRPSVTELVAWVHGDAPESASGATVPPATTVPPAPAVPDLAPRRTAAPAAAPAVAVAAPSTAKSANSRAVSTAVLGAIAILALGWTAMRIVRSHRTPPTPPATERSLSQTPGAATSVTTDVRERAPAASPPKPSRGDLANQASPLHEAIPEVPWSARRTIKGHINVWVRVIVDPDGSVFAATADRVGPSRYFHRLSIEAAKQWKFPPIDTDSRRLMQIRFDFSRDGTTASAVTLH